MVLLYGFGREREEMRTTVRKISKVSQNIRKKML